MTTTREYPRAASARRRGAVVAAVVLIASWSRTAPAQAPVDTVHVSESEVPPVAAWLSWGGGPGKIRGTSPGLAAGVHKADVSIGHLLLSYRSSDLGPAFGNGGEGVRDQAALVGIRTAGRRSFGTMALGYAHADEYNDGGVQCIGNSGCVHTGAMAFDVSLHANWIMPGLAVSYSGTVGPARVAYSVYTVALELGWFGR